MNLALLLDMAADAMGERVAVGDRSLGLTHAQVREQAGRVAAALGERGASRLVFAGENDQVIPVLLFGAALAGVPFTAVNYRLADDRLVAALQRCAPAVVVADDRTAPRVAGVAALDLVGAADLTGWVGSAPPVRDVDPDAVAVALFTSGTSGDPKSVLLRHRNLVSYVIGTTEFMGAGEEEAALVSVPPYHIAGVASVLSNGYLGRRMVYLPTFDAAAWVDTVRRQGITHAMVVPTMMARVLEELERDGGGLPTLRHLSYGGGRMPLPVIHRALSLLPDVSFVNAYGLTETSSTIALLGPEDHRRALAADHPDLVARLGSVGRAVPGIEIQVRSADGRPLPAGIAGLVVVRGEQVAGEYESADVKDADGWFPTNDTGWLDQDGYLFLEGRADDVIVRGGENLSPGEIEDVLIGHPAVADAAVVGAADQEWGEAVVAFVVLRAGSDVPAEALQDHVVAHLRSSRRPERVVFCDDLPYNETGKLVRRELRARALAPTS